MGAQRSHSVSFSRPRTVHRRVSLHYVVAQIHVVVSTVSPTLRRNRPTRGMRVPPVSDLALLFHPLNRYAGVPEARAKLAREKGGPWSAARVVCDRDRS